MSNIGDSLPPQHIEGHITSPDILYREYRGFRSLRHIEHTHPNPRYFVSRISGIHTLTARRGYTSSSPIFRISNIGDSLVHSTLGYPLYPPIFHIVNIGDPVQLAALVGAIVPITVLAANNIWYLNLFSPCSSLYNIIKYIN